MNGLRQHKYLTPYKSIFDPISAFVSVALLVGVLISVMGFNADNELNSSLLFSDYRSLFFVVGGTFGCLLFQFDALTLFHTFGLAVRSFIYSPSKTANQLIEELDEVIIKGGSILSIRAGEEITGELLNDIVHMVREKLFYEEIDSLVANKIANIFLARKISVALLNKGAKIAPALGLLGTVIGLIDVLQSLEDPSKIGPAMSLALMTTAFGSILGSLVFTPLAGRLEHHNNIYLETHKLLMSRVNVLLKREERYINPVALNKKLDANDES